MTIAFWLLAGGFLGLAHVTTLHCTVNRARPNRQRSLYTWLILGGLLRLSLAAVLLILALREGPGAGLAVFGGFWLVRWPLLRWYSRFPMPERSSW